MKMTAIITRLKTTIITTSTTIPAIMLPFRLELVADGVVTLEEGVGFRFSSMEEDARSTVPVSMVVEAGLSVIVTVGTGVGPTYRIVKAK